MKEPFVLARRIEGGHSMKIDPKSFSLTLTHVALAPARGFEALAEGVLCVSQGGSTACAVCRLRKGTGPRHAKLDLRFSPLCGKVRLENPGLLPIDILGHLGPPGSACGLDRRRQVASVRTCKRHHVENGVGASSSVQPDRSTEYTPTRMCVSGAKKSKNQEWDLKYVEATGERLDRHKGAERDARPAWMTRGLGIGTCLFGELGQGKNELLKPGMTRGQLEDAEQRTRDLSLDVVDDPFADVFREAQGLPSAGMRVVAGNGRGSWRRAGALPSQNSTFAGRGAPPRGRGRQSRGRGYS